MAARAFKPPEECPVCGASVPPRAHACPECGADERSGWNEEGTHIDGLDLPDPDAEAAFERRKRRLGPTGVPVVWWIVGLLLAGLLIYGVLLSGWG